MKNKYLAPLMMPFLLVSLFGCSEKPSSTTSSSDLSTTSNNTTPIVTTPNPSTTAPSTPVISSPVNPLPIDPKSVPLSHVPYAMEQFKGVTASDTIANMIGKTTIENQTGNHWKHWAANATKEEKTTTVEGLQYRIKAGIDSPRVVGSPVMAYSPLSKTSETELDKKLHGVIDANGNVTELPQYASWQWALKFTKGATDTDSYFELVSFIGGPASSIDGDVTEINNNWPATQAELGNNREVFATQAIRHLGDGTNPSDDVLAANLRTRGGYIQDYQRHGIDPVSVILPGYITVADGDTLYTEVKGTNADNFDLTTSIFVGKGANEVKAGTYPVKRGLRGATAGNFGPCGYNQLYSTLSQIWTPGFEEFGNGNAGSLYNLRSLSYLGSPSLSFNSWGGSLGYNYDTTISSLYYNAIDLSLKSAFNNCIGKDFKSNNKSLIDNPTGLTPPELPYNSVF